MSLDCSIVEEDFPLYSFAQDFSVRWQGRDISLQDALELKDQVQQRLLQYLFSQDLSSPSFEPLAAKLAWLGTDPQNLSLLAKEIAPLFSRNGIIIQVGLGKQVSKFWKEHKTAIIIGAIVVAVIVTAVVVTTCTAGAGTGPTTAGGTAVVAGAKNALEGNQSRKKETPRSEAPRTDPRPLSPPLPDLTLDDLFPAKDFSISPPGGAPHQSILFQEDGFTLNNHKYGYPDILMPTVQEEFFSSLLKTPPPLPTTKGYVSSQANLPLEERQLNYLHWLMTADTDKEPVDLLKSPQTNPPPLPPTRSKIREVLSALGETFFDPEFLDPNTSANKPLSKRFEIIGLKEVYLAIGGINGINTPFDNANKHALYLSELAGGRNVTWVHNNSHGFLLDLVEIFSANFLGHSPNNEQLLLEQWREFHELNKDNPHAKFLQFCHSQGTIHVRNALMHAPQEIRDRLVVVAIAPATVIPRELCYQANNYASKKDIVPFGELAFLGGLEGDSLKPSLHHQLVLDQIKDIVWLDPHPDAEGVIDHDFQSPTFSQVIKRHIEKHIEQKGEYIK